jgi:hypothetical protein
MRGYVTGVVLAALLLGSACGGDSDSSSDTTNAATTTTTVPCEPDDLDASELEAVTVEGVPAGFERQPDDVGDTGPSDQAKAISDDGQDGAAEALADFRRGYQWLWEDGGGNQLISFIYEFCDAAGATGYAQRGAELTENLEDRAEPFDAPGVEESAAVVGEDAGYQFAYVDITEGPFLIHVAAIQQPPEPTTTELEKRAADLAAAQLAEVQELSGAGA